MLSRGGNAFDAAIAVAGTLAVVEPFSSGLGGGGFWLLHRARGGEDVMLDGRERAPFAAAAGMYLDAKGELIPKLSVNGPLAAGIPGMPAALAHLAGRYGRLSLERTLAPAIRHAEEGFAVGTRYCRAIRLREEALRRWPGAAAVFFDRGRLPQRGFQLIQSDVARTLKKLARKGRAGFYEGDVAARLVHGVRRAGGNWTLKDLSDYRAVERQPLRAKYRSMEITTVAPPGGGAVLLEALNVLAAYDLQRHVSATRKHLIVEAMRRSYHDRERYLGDPDFVSIPLARLLSLDYAAGLNAAIRTDRALPSAYLAGENGPVLDGGSTTHFSILDREGNYVAATLSINYPFGSAFVAPGTGVVLNDEMDDFAAQPGKANLYGLVGGEANKIAPGKRMLSSMTPTFLEDDDRLAILGTPGGSRIISMVLLAALDFADGRGVHSIVARGRFHHQYLPDRIELEPGVFSPQEMEDLRRLGHELRVLERPYGDMHAVIWDKHLDRVTPASDPRGEGLAATIP